ncbi:MAG: precorrin-6A reductase [Eubacteriales bacterium]|nr:precorrin-6A reductase [Eubacteriales bacterium]
MYKVIVFAGTTEGYAISRFLAEHHISVLVCVATSYGKKSLTEGEFLSVHDGRLDLNGMIELIQLQTPELVIDATHPYAAIVTETIREACSQTNTAYHRLLRAEGKLDGTEVYVDSIEEAIAYLEQTKGNILITTGSKELAKFQALSNYQERIFARVLSLPSVMLSCAELGIEGKHLIGMQGPFSTELNEAMLKQYDCKYLVTKNSGKTGGFAEKLEAAQRCGVTSIVIGRPLKETGDSLEEMQKKMLLHFGITVRQKITLLGIGMGDEELLTIQAKNALKEADLLIGAKRIADSVSMPHHKVIYEYVSDKIIRSIIEHPGSSKVVIALSGDVGFYSGAKKLLDQLKAYEQFEVSVVCGISSVVYFMSQIGLSWDDAVITSAHGRSCNLLSLIRNHRKVFSILGTSDGIASLAKQLCTYGMGEVILYVGEKLSYTEEKIFSAKASELTEYVSDPLSVICAVNNNYQKQKTTHGISDDSFTRGKAPMTKEEIRTISLAKLQLEEDSICYDIGAGTGSVSVEMALRASQGQVYAIERKEEAADLIEVNKIEFALDHLRVVRGLAPEAMIDLPAPTHAFIGGSAGNLKEIVEMLLNKNKAVRIVINCITLETVAEIMSLVKEKQFETSEIVQVMVSRAKTVANYHLMMGENPIYIVTLCNASSENE